MSIQNLLYALDCDVCGGRFSEGPNRLRLFDQARAAGWAMRRRKDGQVARTGGKDYCPRCAESTFGEVKA